MIKRVFGLALSLIGVFGIGGSALQAACPGGVSASFTVSGAVTNRAVFNLRKLKQFPPAQANVTYFAGGSVATEAFTGVLLWDLLNNSPVSGITTNPSIKNDILHKVVIVTGADCYQSIFGAGEFDPFFGGSQIMVAYATAGSRSARPVLRGSLFPETRLAADLSRILSASRCRTRLPIIRTSMPAPNSAETKEKA
jgi:hypothetical protein